MIKINICPGTLAQGFDTYSPVARRMLFNGQPVSHIFADASPSSDDASKDVAISGVGRISLSGVQPKFSVVVRDDMRLHYTVEGEQGKFILKPAPVSHNIYMRDQCVANEHLTMQIASQVYGIETAKNAVCFFSDDEAAYITKRFDINGDKKYQQEDFASLLGYTKANGGSDYKYCNASYEECAEVIRTHTQAWTVETLKFFRLILFNFVFLNDDAHLKNFSLINIDGDYRLTPAYDLINTSLHLSQPRIFALDKGLFKEGMSFSDTNTIKRADFIEFGRRIGLSQKIIERETDRFSASYPLADSLIENSFLSAKAKREYGMSIVYRRSVLKNTPPQNTKAHL